MNVWLLKTGEPLPTNQNSERLLRMGMIANELNSRGHKINWFTSSFDHFKKEQICERDTKLKVNDNYIINISYAKGYKKNISISRIINHKVIAKKFRKQAEKMERPDLIYASFPTIDYASEAVKYGKKHNVPVIIDIRDLWPDIFKHNLPQYLRIFAMPYIKLMDNKTNKVMKNAFAINANSEAVLEWGLKKGNRIRTNNDRFFFIGYKKEESDLKTSSKNIIDKDKFNISFFATINNQFDYDKIVEIAKKLEKQDNDVSINICGDGPQMNLLKEKTKELPNIKLLGWTEKNDLIYILENSKMGLAPYKNTFDFQMTVSNKFAEYIAYGLPVIITSEGYMKELIEKNNCGISSQDTDAICKYIIELKNDNKKYQVVSKNAKKLYEENFVAEDIYKDLVDYLEKIKGGVEK